MGRPKQFPENNTQKASTTKVLVPHQRGRGWNPAPDMVVRVKTPHKIFFISCFVLKLAETNKVGIKFSKGR